MAEQNARASATAVLWCVAAVLAWTAVAIRRYRGGEIEWSLVAAGLFCAAMGIGAWTRRPPPRGGVESL